MNMRQSAARLKRGGGVQTLPLDFDGAEREVAARVSASMPEPDQFFHQEFVRALFERAVQDLRAEYDANGRLQQFTLFERYDLDPVEGVSYAQLAQEFTLTTTQVTNALAQVRRRFRERALAALRGLCGSDEEFRREARDLFGMDVE
jgi:DNA-directed RNA polymerase specialized sigma24 family protein